MIGSRSGDRALLWCAPEKPENPEAFIHLQDDDIDIYLARDIWQKLEPGTEKLLVAVQNYGRFWMRFEPSEPAPETPG